MSLIKVPYPLKRRSACQAREADLTYADVGNRTRDLRTTNAVRYLLCHVS